MWLLVYDRFVVTLHVSFVNTQKLIYTTTLHVFCLIKQQTRLSVDASRKLLRASYDICCKLYTSTRL